MSASNSNVSKCSSCVLLSWRSLILIAAIMVALATWQRGRIRSWMRPSNGETPCSSKPMAEARLITTEPECASNDVPLDVTIRADVDTKSGKLNTSTVGEKTVALFRVPDRKRVPITITASDDGRAILVKPVLPLEPEMNYSVIFSGLRDSAGGTVSPKAMAFTTTGTTAKSIAGFEQLPQNITNGMGFTCVTFGPDGKFYGCVDDGRIMRYIVAPDGSLSLDAEIRSLSEAHKGSARLIVGLVFDPKSTAEHPVAWLTHGKFGFENVPDFTTILSRMSGKDLEQVEDVLIHLPRSARDHVTHQPIFGPDGALYFQNGSSSGGGDREDFWGNRTEHLLTASVLRLDISKLPGQLPLDVKTVDAGGSYDPRSTGAPLTIYAEGVRVSYDLLWASNGNLYGSINGSCAGLNTPTNGIVPAIKEMPTAEHDWMFLIHPGKYYGHPNPSQGHYVFNGGNPTADVDPFEVGEYPVGTQTDPKYEYPIYDFGSHTSSNGMLQYQGNAFEGKLKGAILVCRYNVGGDLLPIMLDNNGQVARTVAGIKGLGNLQNPLDVCEDTRNGNLYVAEYGGARRITLIKPLESTLVKTTLQD